MSPLRTALFASVAVLSFGCETTEDELTSPIPPSVADETPADPVSPEDEVESPEAPESPEVDAPEVDPPEPETPDVDEPPQDEGDAPFGYEDSPELGDDGRPVGWTESTHAKGADPAWDALFDLDTVHRIDIAMPASTHQEMMDDLESLLGPRGEQGGGRQPGGRGERPAPPADGGGGGGAADLVGGDPVWVPVSVAHDGKAWHHVGMRFKGNSSLSSTWRNGGSKIGFRLTFDKFEDDHPAVDNQRFHGFKKMTFAAGYSDPSMVRDIMAGELMRSMGIPAARAAFYEVYVDIGEGPTFWGLYTMIEDPSDQLIEAYFDDDDGNIYKPDGTGADWTLFDEDGFEKKSNEDDADWSDIQAAIDALHADNADAVAWRAQFEQAFDVPGFVRWLAINQAMVNWDVYGAIAHNYYLYGDPDRDGQLTWIPWDHNESFSPARRGSGSLTFDDVTDRWPLIRFVVDDPVYRQLYLDTLAELMEGTFTEEWLFPKMEALHALAGPSLAAEAAPYTQLQSYSAYESALDDPNNGIFAHVRDRRAEVADLLDTGWIE